MKLAFIGETRTELARLEQLLFALIERRKVDAIVPIGPAGLDIHAVVRARERRFRPEVPWNSPEYSDFVLQAVLEGIGAVPSPADELERTVTLNQKVRRPTRKNAHLEELGTRRVLVLSDDAPVAEGAHLVVVPLSGPALDRPAGRPPRLRPGRINAEEGALCAEVENVDDALEIRFIDAFGEVTGVERVT